MVLHNGSIFFLGGHGNEETCLKLNRGVWEEHTTLNEKRMHHSVVTTETVTFIFGGLAGFHPSKTYEYLPKDSTKWLMGKTEIPGRDFSRGCAVFVKSKQEIWLIGGYIAGAVSLERILIFNVNDHTFRVAPSVLNVARYGHRCAFIPNTNKILITGGRVHAGCFDSTEILDPKDGSVTMASPMNTKRAFHGMGVITINGEERLAVFGGNSCSGTWLDSVELYNSQTQKWETTTIKLNQPNSSFGFLTVKLADIVAECPKK